MLYLSSLIFVEINDMHFKKLFTTDINNPYKNMHDHPATIVKDVIKTHDFASFDVVVR